MKKLLSFTLSMLMVVAVITAFPVNAFAGANENDFTFKLIENGKAYAVMECKNTTSEEIVIPETYNGLPVTVLAKGAIKDNNSLVTLVLPDTLKHVRESATTNCANFKAVKMGAGIKTIHQDAVVNCPKLKDVYIKNVAGWCGVQCVDQANRMMFSNYGRLFVNDVLIEELVIPDGVETVEIGVFCGYENIKRIIISDSVKVLKKSAFEACYNLETVVVGKGVTELEPFSIGFCRKLKNIYFTGDMPVYNRGLRSIAANVYYPQGNDSWNKPFEDEYSTLTFKPYNPFTITSQPKSVTVASGKTASATVKTSATGLKYEWYYCDKGAKTFSKSSIASNTYSVTMNSTRAGRQVYCVITDTTTGYFMRTNTVTLGMYPLLKITQQPMNVSAPSGSTVLIPFEATGEGITYTWYYKDAGGTKFVKTSTFKSNYYSVEMTPARSGRQIYCVVTDKYGVKVKTNVVTLTMVGPLAITTQPTNVTVAAGETADVSFKATGEGLTYTWYYKNAGGTKFVKTTTFKGNTYSVTMDSSRAGRQIYCVVKDKYGKTVQTNTVALNMSNSLKLTAQPKSVTVAKGETAKVVVTATGDGLTYKWYYANKGASTFTYTSTFKGNTYSVAMDSTRVGRRVYCVVTDKYGNSVKTNTVTLSMK